MRYKKQSVTIAMIIASTPMLMAAGSAQSHPLLDWMLNNIVLVIAGMVLITALASLWYTFESIVYNKKREMLAAQGIELKPGSEQKSDSIFKKLYDKAWSLVPMDKESEIDLGHDYDGIRELDNRLPPWWLYTFYLTIAIAIGYLYVYHFSDIGLSQKEEYAVAMEEARQEKLRYLISQANAVDETNVVALSDEGSLSEAKELFLLKCASCHGKLGEGLKGLGPNFTDPYWIHGGGVKNIFRTIKYGVPEKGMISWQTQLQPGTMQKLASYILTLQGTNPPNPKDPEGTLWEEVIEADAESNDG